MICSSKHLLLLISVLFWGCISFSQNKLSFDLVFGSYMNDHALREIYVEERRWVFDGKQLVYWIDAHDTRYVDTLMLSPINHNRISDFVQQNQPEGSIIRDLTVDYFDSEDWIVSIVGHITWRNVSYDIQIKANGPSLLEEDPYARKLHDFETLLYDITESND